MNATDHEVRLSGDPCCANTGAGSSCCARRNRRSAASCSRARRTRIRSARFRRRPIPSSRRSTADIERALRATFDHQKINYLALMMVDPHVHFHVIPRYSGSREFEGSTFARCRRGRSRRT